MDFSVIMFFYMPFPFRVVTLFIGGFGRLHPRPVFFIIGDFSPPKKAHTEKYSSLSTKGKGCSFVHVHPPYPSLQWLEKERSNLSNDGKNTNRGCYYAVLSDWNGIGTERSKMPKTYGLPYGFVKKIKSLQNKLGPYASFLKGQGHQGIFSL